MSFCFNYLVGEVTLHMVTKTMFFFIWRKHLQYSIKQEKRQLPHVILMLPTSLHPCYLNISACPIFHVLPLTRPRGPVWREESNYHTGGTLESERQHYGWQPSALPSGRGEWRRSKVDSGGAGQLSGKGVVGGWETASKEKNLWVKQVYRRTTERAVSI